MVAEVWYGMVGEVWFGIPSFYYPIHHLSPIHHHHHHNRHHHHHHHEDMNTIIPPTPTLIPSPIPKEIFSQLVVIIVSVMKSESEFSN